ncbi:MAG: KH domain-containing protein [Erysipelotrichaceae bacterium]|nr:KH domain-containing protein [Erysipelotrichaceae bacterium]
MVDLENVLLNLVTPMVDDPKSVSVKELPSLEDDEIVLCVYANGDDIARLIGKRGNMANSIRSMMNVASRVAQKKISIKFESFE